MTAGEINRELDGLENESSQLMSQLRQPDALENDALVQDWWRIESRQAALRDEVRIRWRLQPIDHPLRVNCLLSAAQRRG